MLNQEVANLEKEISTGRTCHNCGETYIDPHVTTCLKCGHITRPVISVVEKRPMKRVEKTTVKKAARYTADDEDDDEEELIEIESV